MEKLDVLYAINEKFLEVTLASILSLIDNGNIKNINLRLITEDISVEGLGKIKSFLAGFQNVKVYFYPLEFYDIEKYNIPDWRGSQIANARLFFKDILGDDLSEIANLLYLDADTIITGSLDGLEKYNEKAICACLDDVLIRDLDRLNLDRYYNSGVLYINPSKWLEEEYDKKILFTLLNNQHELSFPDQDVLNLALSQDISLLSREYNFGPIMQLYSDFGTKLYFNDKVRLVKSNDVLKARSNPKILHSYGFLNIKPWRENSVNPFNEDFRKYIRMVNPEFFLEMSETKFKFLIDKPKLVKLLAISKTIFPTSVSNVLVKVKKSLENREN